MESVALFHRHVDLFGQFSASGTGVASAFNAMVSVGRLGHSLRVYNIR